MPRKKKFRLKDTWGIFKETYIKLMKDNTALKAAGISYYTLISMVPLTVFILVIADVVFGERSVKGQILSQVQDIVGKKTADSLRVLINSVQEPRSSTLTSIFGVAILIFTASHVFNQLRNALNDIWKFKSRKKFGIMNAIKGRVISFGIVTAGGTLLIALLVSSTGLVAFDNALDEVLPGSLYYKLLKILNVLLPFLVVTLLYALTYKYLPEVALSWRDIWVGAVVGAILFSIGRLAVGWYLGNSWYGSAYGIAASVIVVLIWLYWSAQTLFFGAELTQVYALNFGSRRKQRK